LGASTKVTQLGWMTAFEHAKQLKKFLQPTYDEYLPTFDDAMWLGNSFHLQINGLATGKTVCYFHT